MLKKILSLLLYIIIVTNVITGCQSSNKISTKEIEKKEEHQPITISNLNNFIKKDFLDAFEKKYPEVKLELISYGGMNGSGYAKYTLEHGDIADIYVTPQSFSKEAQEKYLLDLSNYNFVNYYSNILLDSLDINGSIYLLPSGYQLTGIYYNKTILKENNWEVPKSFDALVALSEKIEKAGYQTMGHEMSLNGYPFNYFFNIGNTIYFSTPEGTQWKKDFPIGKTKAAGNNKLKKTIEYFNQWIEHEFITTEHMEKERFFEGECVFFLCLGLDKYKNTTEEGKTYEFGTLPWLSKDGSNNMLTRTVSKYMGINKSLADKGNEQKLEDALKLLNYISTIEGQQALMTENNQYMLSLNEIKLPEDSPYQEIISLVNEGRTVPLLYVGWEKQIIPIAQDIKKLINREIDIDELIELMDQTNDELLNGSSDDIYAVVDEVLTKETCAKLVAIAEGKAVDADCAIVSLNSYHGEEYFNNQGTSHYLYEGDVNTDIINIIRPRSTTISTIEMTGAEIRSMQTAGFDLDKNGNPYEYLLFTKEDMELKDNVTYKLAISTGELSEDFISKATETEKSPLDAIRTYLRELGHINADAIQWD